MYYFLIYLFLEVLVSVNIASELGGLYTFLELLGSALLGLFLISFFSDSLPKDRQTAFAAMDPRAFLNLSAMALGGAVLLIIPGFLTDIIGVLLYAGAMVKMTVNRFMAKSQPNTHYTSKDENVIDVEIVSDDSAEHRPSGSHKR